MKGSTKKILITLLLINIYDLRRWELNFVNCANIIDYNNDVIDVTELILNETISQEVLEENLNMLTPTSINLSNRNLTFVPSKIKFLKNLIHFNSCNNALIDFCELPTSLKYINLSVNKIENLPEHFFNLINLEVIIVRHNYLSEFPKLIENFINLKIIDFSFNNIFIIHSTIGELFNVEKIILMDNKIKSLPDSIGKLTKLNYIDLSLNNLSKFPDNCSNLCMLYQLNLSDNSFTNIETICNIKSIKILFLSRNYISLIPNNINNLENLQCLDLSGNAILNIKPICNLKVLETLYLCDNNISEISSNICNLKNLSFLSLSDNNISYLPKELIKCKNLRVLFLKNNEIKTIHNDLFEMLSNLDFLDLRGNSIKYPADSTDIDIHELKVKMGDKLLIDDYKINIYNIYAILNAKPIKFKFLNLRKCRPYTLPLHIYSEQELFDKINDWEKKFNKDEYKTDNQLVILDPNEFTDEIKPFDTEILKSYISHLYNPEKRYLKWNVPRYLLNEFKKYIGAIIFKLFSSDDIMYVEGHLTSLSTAICYCHERQKNELIFLYELLINGYESNLEQESKDYIETVIRRFIGTAKKRVLIKTFSNPENTQNVHTINYWEYVLKDHIGLDVFGNIPELIGQDKFNGVMELGLKAFFEKFTPEWLVSELKNDINNDGKLICKITEFLYHSEIQDDIKIKFVECENDDILYTKSVTDDFCWFILKKMEIILVE